MLRYLKLKFTVDIKFTRSVTDRATFHLLQKKAFIGKLQIIF